MAYTWRVILDRYADESKAKSGLVCSVVETCEILIKKYNEQLSKPELEVFDNGLGVALCDMLEDRKVPFKRIDGLLMRINGADILKTRT